MAASGWRAALFKSSLAQTLLAAAALAVAGAAGFVIGQGGFGRARVEGVVHDYILAHPEVLSEAGSVLRDREAARVIDANRASYETPFAGAWAGAEHGDVVLVEFFDYACGYCRATNPAVDRLLREDPRLKVVWRDYPVLGPDSVAAARLSLAAARQGRFRAFHDKLFAAGHPTAAGIARAEAEFGLKPLPISETDPELSRNYSLAQSAGSIGTPTFVIGNKVLHGAVGYEVLRQAIADARKQA